jgi:hypothetical protein
MVSLEKSDLTRWNGIVVVVEYLNEERATKKLRKFRTSWKIFGLFSLVFSLGSCFEPLSTGLP